MDQKIIYLYDAYTHAPLPRRVFLARLANLAGGAAAAAALLPLLEGTGAEAAMIAEDDPRLTAGYMRAFVRVDSVVREGRQGNNGPRSAKGGEGIRGI